MAQGQKPVISIVVVKKTDKTKKVKIGAAWLSDRGGLSGKFETGYGDRLGIAAIKFTDGSVAKIEDLFLNVYDERMRPDGDRQPQNQTRTGGGGGGNTGSSGTKSGDYGDDDIPF